MADSPSQGHGISSDDLRALLETTLPAPTVSASATLRGQSTGDGIAIGKAFVISDTPIPDVSKSDISEDQVEAEREKLRNAINKVESDLGEIIASVFTLDEASRSFVGVVKLLKGVLGAISSKATNTIESERVTAAYAVQVVVGDTIKTLRESSFMARNVEDFEDLRLRLLRPILGISDPASIGDSPQGSILVSANLSVSQSLSGFTPGRLAGIVIQNGGTTGHAALFAAKHKIPILVGVEGLLGSVKTGDTVVIDELDQKLLISPSPEVLRQVEEKLRVQTKYCRKLPLNNGVARTRDGFEVHLFYNIEDIDAATKTASEGGAGIGLCRTEPLFFGTRNPLSEKEQTDKYFSIIVTQGVRPVTIRTIDFGSDKLAEWLRPYFRDITELNPNMGLRGARLISLGDFKSQVFHPHAAAIIRAFSQAAQLYPERDRPGVNRVMFPMINNLEELLPAIDVFRTETVRLEQEGVKVLKHLEFGTMVETPEACLGAGHIFRHPEAGSFASIGTNDLASYTSAADRDNSWLGHLCTPHAPGVLKLMHYAVRAARSAKRPISICGRMASQPGYLPLLIGLGLSNLSVEPNRAEVINYWAQQLDSADCKLLVNRIINKAVGPAQSAQMLSEFRQKHMQIDEVSADVE
ncbi:MAG: hypothetical protein DCC75_00220 [Proteobacteria bacterium]|nr:MAG: hypothetical protein DCC75_00220 [Pseudomonadota bacterium]